jgi:hypothetical protein
MAGARSSDELTILQQHSFLSFNTHVHIGTTTLMVFRALVSDSQVSFRWNLVLVLFSATQPHWSSTLLVRLL